MRTMLEVDPMGVESEDVEEVENKEVETPQGRGTKRKARTSAPLTDTTHRRDNNAR